MEYLVTSSLFEENKFTYKGQKTVFSGRLLQHLCLLATVSGIPEIKAAVKSNSAQGCLPPGSIKKVRNKKH
jgi:hypothetical protein